MSHPNLLGIVAFATLAMGCATAHVDVARAPSPDAPVARRTAFYEEHGPLGVVGPGLASSAAWSPRGFVVLADGTRVVEPSDLVANVDPDSLTARAASKADALEIESTFWSLAGAVGASVGFAALFTALMPVLMDEPAPIPAASPALGIVGGAGGLLGALSMVPLVIGMNTHLQAEYERQAAFVTYDHSLRARLDLPKAPPAPLVAELPDPVDSQ